MPATATPVRNAPALPGKVLLYRAALAEGFKVDAPTGRISKVSLMTANLQPRGYQMFVDAKSLQTFHASLGAVLKSYLRHSWGDRTGEEAGLFEAFQIVGDQCLADFVALKAWMKNAARDFETLFELAEKAPAEFGASAVFSYTLAWVRQDGSEVPTQATGWRWNSDSSDYELVFEPSVPADALRQLPSIRVVETFSTDFVDVPAANRGLFSATDLERVALGEPAKPVDVPAKDTNPASNQTASFAMIKEINAKFGSNPALLARAIHFHAADDKATFVQVCASVEAEQTNADLAKYRQSDASLTAFHSVLEKAGFKAAGEKSALDVLLAEHAAFKAKATAHDLSEAALKAGGFEAKDGKTAADLALAANKKLTGDIATLKAGGTVAVETGAKPGDAPSQNTSATGRLAAKFAAKAAAQKPANN